MNDVLPKQEMVFKSASENCVKELNQFTPQSTDVFIVTPPKTGTTLLQQICHQIKSVSATGEVDMNFDDIYRIVLHVL